FGRKPCFFSCLLLLILVVFITACAPVYAVFAVGQFFIGFLSVGLFTVAFVLGLELVGPGKRDLAGMVILIFYACGYMMLAVFSKAVNGNWRQLELLIAILYIPFFSYYWLVPESVRWLMQQGRYQHAENILQKAAKMNKVTLPENIFEEEKKAQDTLREEQEKGQ
uniref:Organic cation transporter protein-like n=1 Tax=Saccoglossus kowalevskii TaxID=10224 RepID=A0ABM0LV62_SACKO